MSRSLQLIGSAVLTVFILASPAIAQEQPPASSLPTTSYEIDRGGLLDGAPYISNFECLAFGESSFGFPTCNYYKAAVSETPTFDKISEEICFKEPMLVALPRDFQLETGYRIILETEAQKNASIKESRSFALIFSNEPYNYAKLGPTDNRWHEKTTVVLYDCDVPYNGKSYN